MYRDLPLRQRTLFFPYIRISSYSLYMGKFYIRFEVITGTPSGDSRVNVNDIHSQSFYNLQEYPFEAKDVILSIPI